MSCVGMLLVNLALHEFMAFRSPGATMTTYVDNWSCTANTPDQAHQAYQALQDFTSTWDLDLDNRKLVFWSTKASFRKDLRNMGYQTKLDFRELGAHVRMSQRRTNFTQTVRIRNMEPRWSRLEASPAPYFRKVGALKSAAWPRALHGASNVHLGESKFALLRSGAMRGIGSKMPGANPVVHLGLVEYPTADPAYVALRESFLDARRLTCLDRAAPILDAMAGGALPPIAGPLAIMLVRANDVGIAWSPDEQQFIDEFGLLDLWGCCSQELDFRLCWAWQGFASNRVQNRRGFSGLTNVDPALSRRVLGPLSCADRATIRVARNVSFFTQDALHHIQEGETPQCLFCGDRDSIRHRVYHCPHFQPARQGLEVPPDDLAQLEDFQALHAWGRRTPLLKEFLRALCKPSPCQFACPEGLGCLDLFILTVHALTRG